jgi:hypothetical protein
VDARPPATALKHRRMASSACCRLADLLRAGCLKIWRLAAAYFFLLELFLLELLRLAPLFELELELELFFEPLELEPDLVGMTLSFRRG